MTNKLQFKVDLIRGPIFQSLLLFAIPLFFSNVFQQLYNTVDTMIVGHVLGDLSLAAIGSCAAIYDLLIGFALGIGNGLAIVTARSYGAQDEELLKKYRSCLNAALRLPEVLAREMGNQLYIASFEDEAAMQAFRRDALARPRE